MKASLQCVLTVAQALQRCFVGLEVERKHVQLSVQDYSHYKEQKVLFLPLPWQCSFINDTIKFHPDYEIKLLEISGFI